MKIEGKTSQEYLESIQAYLNEPGELAKMSRSAQKPDFAVKRNEALTDERVADIQNELASNLANFGNGLAADNDIQAEAERVAFHTRVRTMYQCGVITTTTCCVLLCIKNAVNSFPPQEAFYPSDAMKLIKQYIF